MKIKKAVKKMKKMQNELNIQTAGENWTSGTAKNGKSINWWRCVYMETAEFIDSFPWKHWKDVNKPIDVENAKVELVDIWHFLLSLAIKTNMKAKEIAKLYKIAFEDDGIKPIFQIAEELIAISAIESLREPARRELKEEEEVSAEEELDLRTAFILFFTLCDNMDMDMDALYTRYLAKNVLNKFRQDKGYQDGAYQKIWNGEEDNVHAMRLAEVYGDFETLYRALEEVYESLASGTESSDDLDDGDKDQPWKIVAVR